MLHRRAGQDQSGTNRVPSAAGIADLHVDDCRQEGTLRLVERGLDAMEVITITGHSAFEMLRRYIRLPAARLAQKLG